MYKKIDVQKDEDLALWCSYLVAFFCLFRKANCVPKSNKFDVGKILTRENVAMDTERRVVYIYVGFSKTNQFRKKDRCVPIPANDDPALDLYRHMVLLLSRVEASSDSPLFSYGSKRFITYDKFTRRLKQLLYSGHNFRRGGASFLFMSG